VDDDVDWKQMVDQADEGMEEYEEEEEAPVVSPPDIIYTTNTMCPQSRLEECVNTLRLLLSSPQVAEVIDDRPEDVKRLEAFRTSNKWRTLGGTLGASSSVMTSMIAQEVHHHQASMRELQGGRMGQGAPPSTPKPITNDRNLPSLIT